MMKAISLKPVVHERAKQRCEEYGMTFSSYIQMLINIDTMKESMPLIHFCQTKPEVVEYDGKLT